MSEGETTTRVGGAEAGPARLLVVDDEENILLTISEVLRLEGYEVDTAASGHEAVSRLDAGSAYDLVLTDLHMDEGDGLSLLEDVRLRSPLTITIVLTGFAAVESAIAALRHGAYDYLTKPCIIDELTHTVGRGIEHRRLLLSEREARTGLEELNRELEHRVEERTAELSRVNRELTEANRMKDIFLATLSHELRTPLTPVLGWVNLLRSGGAAADPSMLAQGLDAIERNARLQARLVDDLLDISRIVSGKLRIEWEPVDLCAVVNAATEPVRADASARDIRLTVDTPNCPLVVQGAPLRLQQVVWNLLSNAVKFTQRGYEVFGAGSAAEAVRQASERRPGLIISDISMPGTDGYALLAELRRMPGLEAVPAIALTGHAMDEDRERALAAGFAVHIPKPVDPDELLRIVRRLTA